MARRNMPEFHRNSPRVFSRRVAPAYRGGPGPSREFRTNSFRRDSSRVPYEGPALFTLPFLGRAPRIALWVAASCPKPAKGSRDISGSFVGRGFSLSLIHISSAFSTRTCRHTATSASSKVIASDATAQRRLLPLESPRVEWI